MRFSRFLLSLAGLAILLSCVAPGWADKIPRKQPSDFGDQTSDVQLTTPAFTAINQDGVSLDLVSVFCNSCSLPDSPTNLEYFFQINLADGANLASLAFGPGFDVNDLSNFGVVQFDNSLDGNPCENGGVAGGAYICGVPISKPGLDFSTVASTVVCAADGSCTVDFTNFNFATLGGGNIILAATTPFGGPTALADPLSGQPLTPSVVVNGKSVTVPEPGSFWFAGLATLICVGATIYRKNQLRINVAVG